MHFYLGDRVPTREWIEAYYTPGTKFEEDLRESWGDNTPEWEIVIGEDDCG